MPAPRVSAVQSGLFLCLTALLCACSASAPRSRRPALTDGIALPPSYESPGRWRYHPRAMAQPVVTSVRSKRGTLVVAAQGERWWRAAKSEAWRAADELAPEPLTGAVQITPTDWRFVGEGGTVYLSRSATGSFERAISPPERLVRVSASEQVVLGITMAGKLLRTGDWGASWEQVSVPARGADVALLRSGEGLLLTVPEQLYVLHDGARQVEPAGVPPFGALQLEVEAATIRARSILQDKYYEPGATPPFRNAANLENAVIGGNVPFEEDAEALAEGRALRTRERYYELLRAGERLELWLGGASGALSRAESVLPGGCPFARLGGDDAALYLICSSSAPGHTDVLRFFRSANRGLSWVEQGLTTRGDLARIQHATLGGGELVVAGVCPAAASGPGCRAAGVHLRVEVAAKSSQAPCVRLLRPLAIAGLEGSPLAITGGARVGSLVVLGMRSKGDALAVFTSLDGGRTFRAEPVTDFEAGAASRSAGILVESARTSAEGYTSFVLYDRNAAERVLVVVDDVGKVMSTARPPTDAARIGANGLAALAVDVARGDAWESLDGGLTWKPIGRSPVALCQPDRAGERCDTAVFCHEQGCAIGSQLSRVGWSGQQARSGLLPPGPPAVAREKPRVLSPIECTVLDEGDWERSPAGAAPDAARASLGNVEWFTYADDFRDGSVKSIEASGGRVRTETLFAPDPHPNSLALYASQQVEGLAALRGRKGEPFEVAWRNLFEGNRTQRARLPESLVIESGPTRWNARIASPDLVSISSGGLYVRAARGETKNPAYFVAANGSIEEVPRFSWAPRAGLARNELLRVDGQNLGLWFLGNGSGVVRATLSDGVWQLDAAAPGLIDPRAFGARQRQDLTYTGSRAGLSLLLADAPAPNAWVFPFRASGSALGPPVAVATQARLPDLPTPCSDATRATTPRVIAPRERGTQHPVVIRHNAEPFRTLLTDEAVLYGSAEQPCVDVFDAATVERSATEELAALVHPTPDVPSWVFRRLGGGAELSYRRMRCQVTVGAEVPPEVYNALERKAP